MEFFESHFKSNEELIGMLSDVENENIEKNKENYSIVIESFNDVIFKFTSLSLALLEKGNFKTKKLFYTNGYLTSISNNFLTIKSTFLSGFHFQLQNIIRSQFEQLNILISFLYDNDFFERFTKKIENKEAIFTPKLKNSEKIIKKIFSSEINISNKELELLNPLFKETYYKLSEATHGNLQRATYHSMEPNGEDSMTFALGGTHKPNAEIIEFISDLNNYSQTIWLMVKLKLDEKNYLNGNQSKNHLKISEKPFFIDYNGKKVDYELLNKGE
ncbi:hypothetical protein HSX10_17390 [Winogradskyella undariae]|uniref:hypothetical protein n=1 Tax=Winogradskyella undariae TaxID=1285465 RepID=UPI00156AD28D|nr:hypothetical protein [Winogradskyella undariae]NRR93351.1 hypothetical protein [Winogradskyella undariae]